MKDERLAVIRAMMSLTDLGDTQHKVISELVTEVERLQLVEANMRPIVAAAAARGMYSTYYPADGPAQYRCQWCWGLGRKLDTIKHREDCGYVLAQVCAAKYAE